MLEDRAEAHRLLKRHYLPPDLKVRAYNAARLAITPLPWLSGLLAPLRGSVLCLGCGYGTLETVLAAANPDLTFVASDFNQQRIAVARRAVHDLPNIGFTVEDATTVAADGAYDNVFFSDLLHHLEDGEQERLLQKTWRLVRPGGALVVKDVGTSPRWKFHWNHFHDRVAAGLPLTYKPITHYASYLEALGAEVRISIPKTRLPYAHYALVATRP